MQPSKIYEVFKNVPQITDRQAHEIADMMAGVADHVTKADMDKNFALLQRSIDKIRTENKSDISDLKTEYKTDIARLEGNLGGEIKALTAQVKMLIVLVAGLYVGLAVLIVSQLTG